MAEEKEKPLTREDVLRLIEKNGGAAKGLDLSGKRFEEGINLSDLDLRGIILRDARFPTHFEGAQLVGAKFDGSDLTGADLRSIDFQYAQFKKLNNQPTCLAIADLRSSSLSNANFQGADLTGTKFGIEEDRNLMSAMLDDTDFRGANLFLANFKGCYFYGTKLDGARIRGADIFDAHLEEVDWGSHIIGEEKSGDFYSAENIYRRLKMWYTNAGIHNTAAEFYYCEKEARRKSIQNIMHMLLEQRECRKLLKLLLKQEGGWTFLWLWIYRGLCGYGEKTLRIIGWAAFVIFGSALIYFLIGSTWEWGAFWSSLYFSAVSFTALGYGSWLWTTNDWIKGLGAFEAFMGVFMMALFLITFVRKMTR